MSFTPISDALGKQLSSRSPIKKQVEASLVVKYAEEVLCDLFGAERASHAKPLYLKNRTLTITCASSAIAQEIRHNQTKIVDLINKKIGKIDVDRIRYLA